jgi:hypothetical protein
MFVCSIFGYGDQNSIYTRDKYLATHKMWTYFNDKNCPTLMDKPKLFFIQTLGEDYFNKQNMLRSYPPHDPDILVFCSSIDGIY